MKNILVRILGYSRCWHHIAPFKTFKPHGLAIAIPSRFHRWLRTNSRIRQYATRINTVCTNRKCRRPPRTTIPYLGPLPMVPETEQCWNCQKHSNNNSYRDTNYQPRWLPFHLFALSSPIQASGPFTQLQKHNRSNYAYWDFNLRLIPTRKSNLEL